MHASRGCGILLPLTSLPGSHGIGDLGRSGREFLDFLREGRQGHWQLLPMGPVSESGSPYAPLSSYAGNHLLISLDDLVEDGILRPSDLGAVPSVPPDSIDYPAVRRFKADALLTAYARHGNDSAVRAYRERESSWLQDYSLFMALRDRYRRPWNEWPAPVAFRHGPALDRARDELAAETGFHEFLQYLFWRQYTALKARAHAYGISVIGDLPMFDAHDSAEVWANQRFYCLNSTGDCDPLVGVPPDYFNEDGQIWELTPYRWDAIAADGHRFWRARLRHAMGLYDTIRLDHFRGYEAYWQIPRDTDPKLGAWAEAPGIELFDPFLAENPEGEPLPFVAEDLGVITPEVDKLRDGLGIPGTKVLQLAFSEPDSPHHPNNHALHSVVYTGTHDSNTTVGWWKGLDTATRTRAAEFLDVDAPCIADELSRLAYRSTANLAILPLQDVLGLDESARINVPGVAGANWRWRITSEELTSRAAGMLSGLAAEHGREAVAGGRTRRRPVSEDPPSDSVGRRAPARTR
ncbi:4-alpha-glucanotransferase [Streptomyces griseus]|uniref:4-alpha-glucanotransferase n=1 Tax=Streptomyces griseus TaxID=1911 RepID=UPI0037BDEB67|nr:4-alpha-glucanotransferase [Streptomyces fimicarius]